MKKLLPLLFFFLLALAGCRSTPPEIDAGEQRIPDATAVDGGTR
jgi:uncharacterized protein YcfL